LKQEDNWASIEIRFLGTMSPSTPPSVEPVVTFSSGRDVNSPPDLRLLHYNDVYHLDPSSAEPVGGIARFVSLCKEYREAERFRGQPELVTLFSGDVFNPSLESSITKGQSHYSLQGYRGTSADISQAATWSPSST
jgi:hypothetical protein